MSSAPKLAIRWMLILSIANYLIDAQLFGGSGGLFGGAVNQGTLSPQIQAALNRKDDENVPTDNELIDGLFWPGYAVTDAPIVVSENAPPGDLVAELRMRHPEKQRFEFECYDNDHFACITQGLTDDNWQLQVLLNGEFDRETSPVIRLPFEIWTFEQAPFGSQILPVLFKNYTLVFSVSDTNDNAPQFSEVAHEMRLPSGLATGTQVELDLYVTDADIGDNAKVELTCDEKLSVGASCQAFEASLRPVPADNDGSKYRVIIQTTDIAKSAKAGDQFGLRLLAVDQPIDEEQLIGEGLVLLEMVDAELATKPPPINNGPSEDGASIVTTTVPLQTTTPAIEYYSDFEADSYQVLLAQNDQGPIDVLNIGYTAAKEDESPKFTLVNEMLNWFNVSSVKVGTVDYRVLVELLPGVTVDANNDVIFNNEYKFKIEASAVTDKGSTSKSTTVRVRILPAADTTTTIANTKPPQREELQNDAPIRTRQPQALTLTAPIELVLTTSASEVEIFENLREGDFIVGFSLEVASRSPLGAEVTDILVDLNIDGEPAQSAFEVYPNQMTIGRKAYLRVKQASLLNFEGGENNYNVKFTAEVSGQSNVATATISILVKDVPENAPRFETQKTRFRIVENSLTGTTVGQLLAIDDDEGQQDKLIYQLFGSDNELFEVSAGVISLACSSAAPCLDRETRSTYNLLLVATDPDGRQSDPTQVIIEIADKNDNRPLTTATSDTIVIKKGEMMAAVVITVMDKDEAPNNESLVTLAGKSAPFFALEQIDTNEYQIQISQVPPPGNSSLTIRVVDVNAIDQPTPVELELNVQVLDAVSTARFKKALYDRTVSSSKINQGNALVQLELEGQLAGDVIFIISNGNPGWMKINENTGELSVGETPLDGVRAGEYKLNVVAIDSASRVQVASTLVMLTVLGKRTQSVWPRKVYSISVNRDIPIEVLSLNPLDPTAPLTIIEGSLEATDSNLNNVDIDADAVNVSPSGTILLSDSARADAITMLRFIVAPDDNLDDRALVVIYLRTEEEESQKNENEKARPVFALPWTKDSPVVPVTVIENAPLGLVLSVLPAHDPITGQPVTDVKITGPSVEYFSIDPLFGRVTATKPFDYELLEAKNRNFLLTVTAGIEPLTSIAFLNVTVVNVDDNAPILTRKDGTQNFTATIMENPVVGSPVMDFVVNDEDGLNENEQFTFELSGQGTENFRLIQQDNSSSVLMVVSPTADLDYEKIQRASVILTATDPGQNQYSIQISVNVMDSNDNTPRFDRAVYEAEIVENWPQGASVVQVQAFDPDSLKNGELTYAIDGGDGSFVIDPLSGTVRTARPLLSMARAQAYELSVTATDAGSPAASSSVPLQVKVLPVDSVTTIENNALTLIAPPIDLLLNLSETIKANEKIYTVRAAVGNSPNVPGDIEYALVEDGGDSLWLKVDKSTGVVTAARDLDYEQSKQLTVIVTANRPQQEPVESVSRLLRINILDEDDNLPVFITQSTTSMEQFLVESDSGVGSVLGQVIAVDADTTDNARFQYVILNSCGPVFEFINVDSQTGVLSLVQPISDLLLGDQEWSTFDLCVMSTADMDQKSPANVLFDATDGSQQKVSIKVHNKARLKSDQELTEDRIQKAVRAINNQTVVTISNQMGEQSILPNLNDQSPSKASLLTYRMNKVNFQPMEGDLVMDVADNVTELIVVEPESGLMRVSPELARQGQGIYSVQMDVADTLTNAQRATTLNYVHVLEDENKLAFVFDQDDSSVRSKLDNFKQKLQEILATSGDSKIEFYYADQPVNTQTAAAESKLCFYATEDSRLMNKTKALEKLTTIFRDSIDLQNLYRANGVTTINDCKVIVAKAGLEQLPFEYVWWILAALLGALILLTLICYVCFLNKYKKYMSKGHKTAPITTDTKPANGYNGDSLPKFMMAKNGSPSTFATKTAVSQF